MVVLTVIGGGGMAYSSLAKLMYPCFHEMMSTGGVRDVIRLCNTRSFELSGRRFWFSSFNFRLCTLLCTVSRIPDLRGITRMWACLNCNISVGGLISQAHNV